MQIRSEALLGIVTSNEDFNTIGKNRIYKCVRFYSCFSWYLSFNNNSINLSLNDFTLKMIVYLN